MNRSRLFLLISVASLVCCWTWNARAQSVDRSQVEKEINDLYAQIRNKENLFLAPSSEDQATFSEYLNQPDKGIIRLLPREKYDNKLFIRGGGAYYSFTRLTHEYGYGSDIELSQNKFSVGFAGFDFGFLISLGEMPLESVTLETPAIKALAEYQPPPTEAEIRTQHQERYKGVKIGGFTYFPRLEAQIAKTYAVRSFDFDNTDVLVSFRVVREDSDGSLTLLWKMLKKFPKPTAIRQNQN